MGFPAAHVQDCCVVQELRREGLQSVRLLLFCGILSRLPVSDHAMLLDLATLVGTDKSLSPTILLWTSLGVWCYQGSQCHEGGRKTFQQVNTI